MKTKLSWNKCFAGVRETDPIRCVGRVSNLVGMVVEIDGMTAPVGSVCQIETGRCAPPVQCEVVGFRDHTLLVMPYGDAEGVAPGQPPPQVARQQTVPGGPHLLGIILDGLGRPIDGGPSLATAPRHRLGSAPPRALTRQSAMTALPTGVRAMDSLVTVARGQRLGIFAGSGIGKSVLLGQLARRAQADVNVLALIGERGREVREFIERDLGPEGLARSVVVVVTSDESAVMRSKGADTAMTIAEAFREGNQNTLFLMDSATRYAMALREIGLATGEPPTTKGYPPSVFAALPRLSERAGWSAVNAMTAFFTVLIEGDDIHDPIGDAMRSILDGHVMLSRDLARQNHYPAIDVLGSISRLRKEVIGEAELADGVRVVKWLKALEDNRDLINIGAYVAGSDPLVDEALAKEEQLMGFLRQRPDETAEMAETWSGLRELVSAQES